MTRSINASRALSITRIAQIGVGVLACGAAAMAYVGLPEVKPPSDDDFAQTGAGPVDAGVEASKPVPDVSAASSRLARLGNAPKPVAPVVTPTDDGTKDEVKGPVGPNEVRYLGLANIGSIKMALIVDHGKQRFVREGQKVDQERVTAINPDHLVLSLNGQDRQVPLQERSGERVTRLQASPTPASNPAAIVANPNGPLGRGTGIKGLSKLPEEYGKWPPAYQRRFQQEVRNLLQQGEFPAEYDLIEKAKASLEAQGFNPSDEALMKDLETKDAQSGEGGSEK